MKGPPFAKNSAKHQITDVRKQNREVRLNQITSKVLLLIETEIALIPPADRPDFIIPAYVKIRTPR